MEDDDDVMTELPASPNSNTEKRSDYSPPGAHVKTYTGGEDESRLALAAREFGLQEQRKRRRQVRASRRTSSLSQISKSIRAVLLDPAFMDVRMRAVWSSHGLLWLDEVPASPSAVAIMDEEGRFYNNLRQSMELSRKEDARAQGIGGTIPSAILGIIKAMVGPAILYLPHGFATAGWAVALPLLALATVLYLYSSRCLLDCWKLESSSSSGGGGSGGVGTARRNEHSALLGGGSSNIKRRAVLSYPELAYRALGTRGETSVKVGIALMQSGVCLTYLIFVPQNLHTSMQILFGWNISPEFWLSVMVVIQLPLSWVRDIRKFTWTNLIANTLILYGLLTCLGFALRNMMEESETGLITTMWNRLIHLTPYHSSWFLFIGTSVLLFEGSITLLVPLQEAVQDEHDRERFPTVYMRVILSIIAFYTVFAMTCWMSFGDNVRTVLTTSLPAGTLATSVQFAYSIAVVFTFPLQNFPCLEISCRSISKQLNQVGMIPSFWKRRNVIASGLVCLLACVAILTMESLDKVVSLCGSLLGCPIAFVFPPLIHSELDPNLSSRRRIGNAVVASLGILTMILASIATMIAW